VESIRILLAEDDEAVGALLELKLKRMGYEVLRANTGDQAASLLATQARAGTPLDIALLDGRLPNRNGFSVMEEASAFSWVTGGILISADEYEAASLPPGWSSLRKPFDLNDLLARIQTLLGTVLPKISRERSNEVDRLTQEFVASWGQRADALEHILMESDGARRSALLSDFAHALAGTAGLYQLSPLEQLARTLEEASDWVGQRQGAEALLRYLRHPSAR
jgi:CheY-like chemotaxis protein